MKRAVVLVILALAVTAVTSSAAATPTRAPKPAAATAAFGRLLHRLYGGIHGYWTCPPMAIDDRLDCLAEVHSGRHWHQVSMSARVRHGVIVFMTLTNRAPES
jgi:hypothetical protein